MADTVVLFDTFDDPAGPLTGHVPNTVLGDEAWFGPTPFSMLGDGSVRDLVASFPYGRSSIGALFPGLDAPAVLEFAFDWGVSPGSGEMQIQVTVGLYDENDDLIDRVGIRLRRASSYASFDIVQNSGFSFGSVTADPGTHLARLNIEAGGQLQAYLDDVLIVSAAFNPDLSLPPTSCVVSFAPNDSRPVNNRFTFYELKLTASGDAPDPPSGKNLYKVKTVTYTPGQQGTPPTPGSPARTVYETRQVCKFVPVASLPGAGGGSTDLGGPGGGGSGDGGGLSGGYIWVCAPERVLVTYPAVPPSSGTPHVEPSTVIDYQLGWNAGARSTKFFTDNGDAQFQVRASVVGVICGLNSADSTNAGYSGTNIDYAFSLARGLARIVENGTVVASIGTYTDATIFKIARSGTDIVYSVDGAPVRTKTGGVTAPLWLEAAMYAGDDEVFAPAITQTSPPDLTTGTGTLAGVLPLFGIFAVDTPRGDILASLPALFSTMGAGLSAPAFAVGAFTLPPLFPTITSLTGEIASLNLTLPSFSALVADHPYGEMISSLPALYDALYALEGNENASAGGIGVGVTIAIATPITLVIVDSTGEAIAMADTSIVIPAEGFSIGYLVGTAFYDSIIEAVAYSFGYETGFAGIPGAGSDTWVVSPTTSGSTTYSNYGFNSFANIGGRYYGANENGLFLLEGDTDDGAPIRASMSLGKLNFGNSLKKTIEQVYIGMSGAGNVFVKIIAEGKSFIYKTRDFNAELQQQRVTPGKGLRTNYVTVELYNENGLDFEIDSVEFVVADMTRKI